MAIFGHNSIILFGWTRDDSGYRIERYDPDGANNEDLGPVHERLFATYIGVGDNVYVVGGRLGDEQGNETDQIDKCNILTRRWTPSSPLAYPRCETATCSVTADFLGDGTQREDGILICGGQNRNGESVKIVELFIPRRNQIHRLPPMLTSRMEGAAVALPDGRVFVAGGCNSRYPCPESEQARVEFCQLNSALQPDDAREFWHPVAPLIHTRSGLAMAYFKGRMIAAGDGPEGETVEVFSLPDADHPLGQWTLATPMASLNSCSRLLLCANRLFAVGGFMSHTVEELTIDDNTSTWRWTVKREGRFICSIYGAASALL
ncbi:Kelch-like [Sparganum proliferum]